MLFYHFILFSVINAVLVKTGGRHTLHLCVSLAHCTCRRTLYVSQGLVIGESAVDLAGWAQVYVPVVTGLFSELLGGLIRERCIHPRNCVYSTCPVIAHPYGAT